MSRKPLGPPPDWISPDPKEQNGQNRPSDPLRSIFSEARAVRTGESEVGSGITRLARDRALQQRPDVIADEIKRRLREVHDKGEFAAIYTAPTFTADVADTQEVRLVLFGPAYWHTGGARDSRARRAALSFLQQRGAGPRSLHDALPILAPDQIKLEGLQQAVRDYLAWKSLVEEPQGADRDAEQANLARTKREECDEAVRQHLSDTYCWLLVPTCASPTASIQLKELFLEEPEPLAVRASNRLVSEGLLITEWSGSHLRREMDRIPLWSGDHVPIAQLADAFARYLFLPRLRDTSVLLDAIRHGLSLPTWAQEAFAYGYGWDELRGRYLRLSTGPGIRVTLDPRSVLVKPEVALRQAEAEAASARPGAYPRPGTSTSLIGHPAPAAPPIGTVSEEAGPHRFSGRVPMDAGHFGRDAGKLRLDIVERLTGLSNAKLKITLQIEAEVPGGIPEETVRELTANCRELDFSEYRFENE